MDLHVPSGMFLGIASNMAARPHAPGGWHFRPRTAERRDGWAALLGLAALGLAGAGVGLLASAGAAGVAHDRSFQEVREAADRWTAGERGEFQGLQITGQVRQNGTSDREFSLAPTEVEVWSGAGDRGPWELVDLYRPLKYTGTARVNSTVDARHFGPVLPRPEDVPRVALALAVGGGGDRAAFFEAEGVPLYKVVKSNAGSKRCRLLHGVIVKGYCVQLYTLAAVCVKIGKGAGGRWDLDSALGGDAGCEPNSHTFATDRNGTVHYRAIGAASLDEIEVGFTVRSAADPYLIARNATHGSLSFGATTKDRKVEGTLLLTVGIVLSLPAVFVAIDRWKLRRRRRHHLLESDDEADRLWLSVA